MNKIALMSLTIVALAACDSEPKPAANADRAAAADGPAQALAKAEIGRPAPEFELPDLDGNTVKLSDYRGKTVVLEWFNPECPFVKFAHSEGPLETLAREQTDKGVVWIAVNSGAPGKQGHGLDTNRQGAKTFGMSHPLLMDESGEVGQAYGAKTTPHLFIVDPSGNLVFRGGVDNAPMGKAEGDLQNYVTRAIEELAAGAPVTNADVRSYGCSVKYAS